MLEKGAGAIRDPTIRDSLNELSLTALNDVVQTVDVISQFTSAYDEWIHRSRLNSIIGLSGMRYPCCAVTQAIAEFAMQHHQRRLRFFHGEYPGTTQTILGHGLNYAFLQDCDLAAGDAVIMSAPFSASGDVHPDFYEVLSRASLLNIPVMIDCAFWGICVGIHLDLTYPCIKTVAFSLSKCFWMGDYRIGMIYTTDPPAGIRLLSDYKYFPKVSAMIGCHLFGSYGPDYLPTKYQPAQVSICQNLGNMLPSKTVIFGIGNKAWDHYKRDGSFNRVSIHRMLTD